MSISGISHSIDYGGRQWPFKIKPDATLRTKKSIQKAYFKPDNFYPFSLHITVSTTLCLKDSRLDFVLKLSTFIIDPIWCYPWRYRHNWLTVNEGNLWLLPPNIGTSADIEASSIEFWIFLNIYQMYAKRLIINLMLCCALENSYARKSIQTLQSVHFTSLLLLLLCLALLWSARCG